MGRHSLPDADATEGGRSRPRVRRRTTAIATSLVLGVAAGAGAAVESGLLSFAGSCEDSAVRIDVAVSPDLAPAVRETAERAREQGIRSDGQCMDVQVVSRENHEVAELLSTGSNSPDYEVWVPDSEIWAERVRSTGDGVPLTPAGNVARTPVVLATVPSAAAEMGWPRTTYTWAELTEAATATDDIRLGSADPARSATGLLALTSVSRSAQRTDPDADTGVAATAKLLSQRVSDTDTAAANTLSRADAGQAAGDPARNQAVFLAEQAAFAYNASAGEGVPDLRLFYPEDGSPMLDYPYELVDETDLSTDESRAATRFMLLLEEPEARAALTRQGFRAPGRPVDGQLVRAAGGRAPQPFAAEGAVSEPVPADAVQQTLGMWTITVQSARLTTVVDISGSMQTPVPGRGTQTRLDVTRAALRKALDQFTPEDEIGLWEFATGLDGPNDYREVVPTDPLGPVGKPGTQRARLAEAFDDLAAVPNGATGLYDTTLAVYKKAQDTYVKDKFNAMVVLTDGSNQDRFSITRSSLISELNQLDNPNTPVPVIAIAIGPEADLQEVDEIARATGGAGYQVSDPAEITSVILKAIMAVGQKSGAAG
ncbi:substrate-binding and VWA domain-containing protein [Streptomyces sp. NPDC015127]|uniref:substrate-binding and VWA domain-containing protein n=1 Tax=Streptomyces sp. NPDC015127 TaxID=3364939 RepID=UPI0036F99352